MEDLLKRYTVREVVLVSALPEKQALADFVEPLWTSEEKGLIEFDALCEPIRLVDLHCMPECTYAPCPYPHRLSSKATTCPNPALPNENLGFEAEQRSMSAQHIYAHEYVYPPPLSS